MSILIKGLDKPKDCYKCPCIQTFADKFICGVTGEYIQGLHLCLIEEAPEPKIGKWIADRYCSECEWDKKDADYTSGWQENYCPNCGADMRGEQNHE